MNLENEIQLQSLLKFGLNKFDQLEDEVQSFSADNFSELCCCEGLTFSQRRGNDFLLTNYCFSVLFFISPTSLTA